MPPQIPFEPTVISPSPRSLHTKTPKVKYSYSTPASSRPAAPSPPKLIEVINIHSTTASSLPWTYAPNQLGFKINDTLYLLAMDADSDGNPINVAWVFTRFDEKHYEYTVAGAVGRTRYDVGMLSNLGRAGLECFGKAESIKQNIQKVLNHCLCLITDDKFKKLLIPSAELRTYAFATTFGFGALPRITRSLGFEPQKKEIMSPVLETRRETMYCI